jgi:sortase B
LTDEWYENTENRYITFITEKSYSIYEVFSVYQILSENYYITTEFTNDEYKLFLNTLKERSKYYFNADVDDVDEILTLSTCASNNKYRVVLHAKKIDEKRI